MYACADERWLSRYNPKDDLLNLKLIQLSPRLAIVAVGAALAALILWRVNGTFPTYFAFLAAGAVLPAMFLYRTIGNLTNWPAFAVTVLYVLVTSLIWEVTLAIPRHWWNYEPSGMIGLTITAWSRGDDIFPVEAAAVWLFAPLEHSDVRVCEGTYASPAPDQSGAFRASSLRRFSAAGCEFTASKSTGEFHSDGSSITGRADHFPQLGNR